MSASLPAPAFTTHVPPAALDEIHEKIKTGTYGKILQDYTNGEIKLSMWIPSDLAGRVIGKKGMVITNLQRETKARVINALPRVGDSLWIAVVIIGDFKTVFDACRAITEIVEDEVDEVVLEFTINYRKPFFIYGGKKFAIVRKISADTNVRIFFPEFNPKEQSFKEAVPMTLEGNSEDVRKAVTLLEREALIYQYQQAHKSERHAADKLEKDKDAASVATAESKEVKSGRRNVLSTNPDTSAPAASEEPKRENTQDARIKQKRESVERVQSNKAAAEGASLVSQATVEKVNKESETAEKEKTAESKTETESTPALTTSKEKEPREPREPVVKVERVINIPTTLVGLLLSKRPKAKNTTINVIQQMTHTIISKMPPAGMAAGAGELAVESQATDITSTDRASEKKVDEEAPATEDGPSSAGRRRRAVSGDEEAVRGDEGNESDSESGSESSRSDRSDSESSESESDSDGEGEDSGDEGEFVDASASPVDASSSAATTTPKSAEGVEGPVEGAVERADEVEAEASSKSGPLSAIHEERKNLKKRMIAESEKLGFVSFRVVGYHQENVDMVVEALESIIKGDRIMEVTDQLKISARSLKWPPKEALRVSERPLRKVRAEREPREPREARDGTTRPERKERPERSERRERRIDPAAEEAARLKYGKDYDPDRVRSLRPKRKEVAREGGAEGEAAGGAVVEGVSSKYKGKTPLTKEERDARRAARDAARDARDAARAADPSSSTPAVGEKPKRVSKGPPRVPGEERPRSAKPPFAKSPKAAGSSSSPTPAATPVST